MRKHRYYHCHHHHHHQCLTNNNSNRENTLQYLPPQTRKEQLLTMIATLQQQVNTMLLQQQESRVEVARPQAFSGKMEEVSVFINAAHLYIRMKMTEEAAVTQVAWVLSYVQGGIAEA